MFTRTPYTIGTQEDLANYLDGDDVFRSSFLYKLTSPDVSRISYTVNLYEYRPDLIAEDFYGDSGYEGILLLQVEDGLGGLGKGSVLSLVPLDEINKIIYGIV